ncbi:hypothetical protein KC19_VG201900 [Ceratodon purpureus]|uniref:Uncharacterized protein n=1 Tax=Ceratodon purpureus TaxID=3225 RepID=A0A8T0HSG4_CERPU|nr:hypothetical protein KC19_VG201900 [Ceratodon purpureus]
MGGYRGGLPCASGGPHGLRSFYLSCLPWLHVLVMHNTTREMCPRSHRAVPLLRPSPHNLSPEPWLPLPEPYPLHQRQFKKLPQIHSLINDHTQPERNSNMTR